MSTRTRRSTPVVVFACLSLVAAACSRDDSTAGKAGEHRAPTPAASVTIGSTDFGDLTDVCQHGAPSGSPTTGVSSDAIHVATFSDVGFTGQPGLNQELFDAADVFASWCNAAGGINGRRLVVDKRDAKVTDVRPRMAESCREDLAMVGGGAASDQDGVELRLQCLLPDIDGFVASAKAQGADLLVQPEPEALSSLKVGALRYLGKKFPDATLHIGVLGIDLPLTEKVAADNVDAARSFGWSLVYNDVYSTDGTATWDPYAQQIKDRGVKGLIWIGEPEGLAKLLQALRDIGYSLDFVKADANIYDEKLIATAGEALVDTPVYVQVAIAPFEGAEPSSATGQYLKAFQRYQPGGKSHTYLGVNAWSAWLLFAKAAASCGNDLTRACLYDAAKKIDHWTGGGLHARTNPASGASSDCFGAVVATPKGFTRVTDTAPNDGAYQCDPKNLFGLTDDADQHTTLADVGQDITNLK